MKKSKNFIMFFVVVAVALGLLGSNTLIALFSPRGERLTTRQVTMSCTTDELTQFHIHPALVIIANGSPVEIPTNVGFSLTCLHPIHTHDKTGTIHVESPEQRDFTLGDFFAVWDKPFNKNQILDYMSDAQHEVTMTVDGKPSEEYENLVLKDLQKIVIEYKAKPAVVK